MEVKGRDLKLGDVVRLGPTLDAFPDCIVKQVRDGRVTLFRPYGVTADFSYTGGVICYTGVEEFSIAADDMPIERIREGRELK